LRVNGLSLGLGLIRRDQLVLPQADLAVHRPRGKALGIQPQIADDVARQALGIGLVVDAEVARVPEHLGVRAQDAHARRVERAHPHRFHHWPHQRGHAVLHLVGGLVGERDREDRGGRHPVVHQVGDAVGEHPGLARTRAGHHQQRPAAVHHRIELIWVQ
jgi:hypothetical protein